MGFLLFCPKCFEIFGTRRPVGSLTSDGDVVVERHIPHGYEGSENARWYRTGFAFEAGTVYCQGCGGAVLEREGGNTHASIIIGDKVGVVAVGGQMVYNGTNGGQ